MKSFGTYPDEGHTADKRDLGEPEHVRADIIRFSYTDVNEHHDDLGRLLTQTQRQAAHSPDLRTTSASRDAASWSGFGGAWGSTRHRGPARRVRAYARSTFYRCECAEFIMRILDWGWLRC